MPNRTSLTPCLVAVLACGFAASSTAPANAEVAPASQAAAEERDDAATVKGTCAQWNTQEFFESATPADVTDCLAAGADVAAKSDDGHTPLHRAAEYSRHVAVLKVLLEAGADLAAGTDGDGHTPLHEAADRDSPKFLQALLASGGDAKVRNDRGETLLHWAARRASVEVVRFLIEHRTDPKAEADNGITPLQQAAWSNEAPAVLEALIGAGAKRDVRAENGKTLLHLAAQNNESTVVRFLIEGGADVKAQSDNGWTPLQWAAWANEAPAVLEALIGAGAKRDVRAEDGRTLLHLAAQNNESTVVRFLIEGGADPNARYAAQLGSEIVLTLTPLHAVLWYGNTPAVIRALIEGGANPEAPDGDGNTPLFHVIKAVQIEDQAHAGERLARLDALLAAGASVETRDEKGRTALHQAVSWFHYRNNSAIIKRLAAAGADPNARDRFGNTPLHDAADSWGSGGAIEALVAIGANIEARNEDGNTPLHLAAEYARDWGIERLQPGEASEAIAALLDAGANATARNAEGETPWDLAQENGALKEHGSEAYWLLNDARFNAPGPRGSRQPTSAGTSTPAGARTCDIPGYPTPANVQSLGLSWCAANVGFQRRAFALQAAGAWCSIANRSSSTPAQIEARHAEIRHSCDMLDALESSDTPRCRCPAGYRP